MKSIGEIIAGVGIVLILAITACGSTSSSA